MKMKIRLFILMALFLFAFSEQAAYAQSNDFFSSTQSANSRFKSFAGALDNCAGCPGFNPCNGITNGGASCDGNGLLRETTLGPVNPDGTQYMNQVGLVGPQQTIITKNADGTLLAVKASPLFPSTGPGALTDNMFGAVADPTQTDAQVALGTTPFGKGTRAPSKCGNTNLTDGSFDPTMDPGVRSGLNCGYLRYDPPTQGMILPAGDNSLPAGQQTVSLTTMTVTSGNIPGSCVLAYNTDAFGNPTTPKVPRASNTGQNCDGVSFNNPPRAFTAIPFNFTNTPQSIPNGLFNEFTFSNGGVICDTATGNTTCERQSLVQDTQTENGTSHAEWAFIWSTKNVNPAGTSSSGATSCGDPINGVAQGPGGKPCVHWFSDYEDSPCHITGGSYDPNVGPNSCRGVATGYGILDVTEGYFVYNGDATASTQASYPMGPQASFGNITGATSP